MLVPQTKCQNKPNAYLCIHFKTVYWNYRDTTDSIFIQLKENERVTLVQSGEKTRTTLSINSKDFEKLPKSWRD